MTLKFGFPKKILSQMIAAGVLMTSLAGCGATTTYEAPLTVTPENGAIDVMHSNENAYDQEPEPSRAGIESRDYICPIPHTRSDTILVGLTTSDNVMVADVSGLLRPENERDGVSVSIRAKNDKEFWGLPYLNRRYAFEGHLGPKGHMILDNPPEGATPEQMDNARRYLQIAFNTARKNTCTKPQYEVHTIILPDDRLSVTSIKASNRDYAVATVHLDPYWAISNVDIDFVSANGASHITAHTDSIGFSNHSYNVSMNGYPLSNAALKTGNFNPAPIAQVAVNAAGKNRRYFLLGNKSLN